MQGQGEVRCGWNNEGCASKVWCEEWVGRVCDCVLGGPTGASRRCHPRLSAVVPSGAHVHCATRGLDVHPTPYQGPCQSFCVPALSPLACSGGQACPGLAAGAGRGGGTAKM